MEKDVMAGQLAISHSSSRIKVSKFDPDTGESDIDTESKDLSDEDKSLRLYEILEKLGVSEKVRQVSREWIMPGISTSIASMFRQGHSYLLHFGSCIEGSSISAMEPDIDVVCLIRDGVINDAAEGIHRPASHLIVQDEWTFPGYVKLQKVSFGKPLDITNSNGDTSLVPDTCGRWCNKAVVSKVINGMGCLTSIDCDKYCENIFKNELGNFSKHGPANRFSNIDTVYAYESYNVLNIIPQWVRRKRLHEWPSTELLGRCTPFPTLLVRTGHPFSKEKEIEWRISFSLFERELMFSLNPTQHKCYVTLKMIKNDILNQALSDEFITSYHLKTCLFWAVENTPEEIWRPDQILRCVCICFWYLLYFVLIKNCPNYFLPAANLFQRPAFLDVQRSLLNVIIHSLTGLVDVICSIKCADVGHLFKGRFTTKITEIKDPCTLDDIARVRVNILRWLQSRKGLLQDVEQDCGSIETRITRWKDRLKELKCIDIPSIMFGFDHLAIKVAKNITSLQINLRLALCFAAKAIATQDETERFQLIKSTMDCSRGLFTARLAYLTLLFKLNRLSECEEVLKDILDLQSCQSKLSFLCQCKGCEGYFDCTDFVEHDITTLFENQITCMIFMPEEKGIAPEPLDFEFDLNIDNQVNVNDYSVQCNRKWARVDGLMYVLFMGYLIYSGLNDVKMKEYFLQAILLYIVMGNMFHHDVVYNLMGWICAREGKLSEALMWWRASLVRHPHRNAVNKYCVDFFSKCVGLGKYIKHN